MSFRFLYTAVISSLSAPAAHAGAQGVSDSGIFVTRRGSDTVATEQFASDCNPARGYPRHSQREADL